MDSLKDIAVVILNWNGRELLKQFLPSVISNSGDAAIYVADNASTDDSVIFVQKNFPTVKIIKNFENGGFAKGYNDALKFVDEPYYLLLNSDIEVTKEWLLPLWKAIQDKDVCAVQPKIKSFSDKDSFEHAGAAGGFIDYNFYPFCRGRIFDAVEKDVNQYDYPTEVFWTSGACMLIKKDAYWEVGGLDEDFFAHMEEIDLCWRMKKKGYILKIVPSSVVYHVGGGTLDYQSPRKTYLNYRNNLYMIAKNFDGFLFINILKRMILDGISGGLFLLKGKPEMVWAILKAHGSFYKNLGRMLSKRDKTAKISFRQMEGVYHGSLVWAFFVKKIEVFNKLNIRKLDRNWE